MATNCGKIGTSIIEVSQVKGLSHLYMLGVGRFDGLLFGLPIPSDITMLCCAIVMSLLPVYPHIHVLSEGRNGPPSTVIVADVIGLQKNSAQRNDGMNPDIRTAAFDDAPVITGQRPIHTMEEQAVTIGFGDLLVEDADSTYPAGFTLQLAEGPNYTVSSDRTVVPMTDYSGTLSVPVTVFDGTHYSNQFALSITVDPVNDAPQITGQVPLETVENQSIALEISQLVIVDPDNENFTLSVVSSPDYSVEGNRVTPRSGFNGTLHVTVFVSDGSLQSDPFDLLITVTPVNDPPVITGQRVVTTTEDTEVTLSLLDLTVTDADPDDVYPNGYTLTILPGDGYTFSGTTVRPIANFTGDLTVNLVVNDGVDNSAPFGFVISVTPQNDPPVITGPATLSTSEDVALAIAMTDLQVADPDNAYPTGFTLFISPGDHYTVSGNSVVPEADYTGTLTVPIQVSDGALTSNIFSLQVQVLPVNDAPVITAQVPIQTGEDAPVTIQFAHLTVLDVDNDYPTGFSLIISPGANYTVSGTTVTPVSDFNGTLNVSLTVSDGIDQSAPFNFQIQVGNANDAPVIIGQLPLSTSEEQSVTLELSHLVVVDPDNPYPAGFSLLVSPGEHYDLSGTTVTPALDFSGTLIIPVRVNDGINNSSAFNFQLQVTQVNDPPTFAPIPNQQVAENAPPSSVAITGISKGPGEEDQQLTLIATSGNTSVIADPVVQYDGGSRATLSWSVVPDRSGVVTITVVAIDNGMATPPHRNTYTSSFQIEVVEINAAPTLDPLNDVTILEDAEQQQVTLSGITAGPGENQSLSVLVTADKPQLFEFVDVAYNSPETNGAIRFKTAADAYGTARLSVTVTDNGPDTAPHVNSVARSFAVVIQPVNDPPVFVSNPVTLAVVDEPYAYEIEVADVDGDKITVSATTKPSWANLSGTKDGRASLRGRPSPGTAGEAQVVLTAHDGTSTVQQTFSIFVNARPEVSTLALATEEDVPALFPDHSFDAGYSDGNGDALQAVIIVTPPKSGTLSLPEQSINGGDTLQSEVLTQLVYTPDEDFFGADAFDWRAYDGYHTSKGQARVDITVTPVNDPPEIVFETDTLEYEVNGEPAVISPQVVIVDPDDDTLTHVTVSFHSQTYRPQTDLLSFESTPQIRGNFDLSSGMLSLVGTATVEDYQTALQSIQYLYQNTIDPLLEPKQLTFVANDGKVDGDAKIKWILLQYTFVEFEIPSGFTPNGDAANDTWVIDRPGGGLDEMDDAIISVYNRHGELVYRARGFQQPWDGTHNGKVLPADSYFYTIDLQLRSKKTYKGVVTILR